MDQIVELTVWESSLLEADDDSLIAMDNWGPAEDWSAWMVNPVQPTAGPRPPAPER